MAAILEKQRAPEQASPTPPVGRGLRVAAAVALAAMAIAAVVTFWPAGGSAPVEPGRAVEVDTGTVAYTEQEQAIMRLVNQGQVPKAALRGGIFALKAAINKGLVPEEALRPYVAPVEPLWCPQELAVMAAVRNGLIPSAALDDEPYRTKRLINQGLIPRAAAEPC